MTPDQRPDASAQAPDGNEPPRCRCGHTRGHYLVTTDRTYTIWGWLALLTGVSAYPVRVRFRCRRCGEAFDESSDPETCRRFWRD